MPGLQLTLPQAARLLGIEQDACRDVIEKLVASSFLRRRRREPSFAPNARMGRLNAAPTLPPQDFAGSFGSLPHQEPHLRVRRLHVGRDPLLPHLL